MTKKRTSMLSFFPRWALITLASVGVTVSLFFLLIIIVPSYQSTRGIRTLSDAVSYAQRMPEGPDYDNTNKVRPDYTTFHQKQMRGYFPRKISTLLSWVGLKRAPEWSPAAFAQVVEESKVRFTQHKVRKNIVYKVTPQAGTRFVVWGDVLGAYHSVVRGLQKLKELSIVDDELKIVADNTYLVFMGDLISRSPYGMETLSLILRLIETNPDRVIYLRGNHEDNKYWHAFGFKDQLLIRLGEDVGSAMVKTIDELFMHLPLGLYLPIVGETGHYVRLSHLGSQRSKKLKEERYAHFLSAAQQGTVDRHQIAKTVVDNSKVKVDAVIRSEKKRHTFQTNDGVRLLEPDQGATTWTVQSAPTRVQQEGLKFFHDAFVIVTAAAHKEQWALTLYSQDVRDKDGFSSRSYQFFTGKQMSLEEIAAVAVSGDEGHKEVGVVLNQARRISSNIDNTLAPSISTDDVIPDLIRDSYEKAYSQSTIDHQNFVKATVLRRQLRHRKAVTYVAPLSPPTLPPAPVVPVLQAPPKTDASNIVPIEAAVDGKSISITVTPPQKGAANKSTTICVTVPHGSSESSAAQETSSTKKTSLASLPVVQPVVRSKKAKKENGAGVLSTATQLEVLERQSKINDLL